MSAKSTAALMAILASGVLLSACASGPDAAPIPDSEEKTMTTGSMIPRKSGSSPTATVSKDAFKDVRAGAIKDPLGGR
ncbi:hypothetical protein WG899_07280 [Paucibacter sp. AS339]|uniref:hypothetical protein n=1 Tax=Paucibacter hankyongi TaxID=3133434 RepID=UPI0030B63A53